MKVIKSKKSIFSFAVITALGLFYLHVPWILRYYPEISFIVITMMLALTGGLLIVLFTMTRIPEKYLVPLLYATSITASFVITMICILTGGFASTFYVVQLGTIILSSVLYFMTPRQYTILVCIYMLQHHLILLFFPWQRADLLKNLFFLLPYAAAVVLIHYMVYYFHKELETLIGHIPICPKCKKIKGNKGSWDKVEQYISEHSDVDFTHSICPECMEKLYGHIPEN